MSSEEAKSATAVDDIDPFSVTKDTPPEDVPMSLLPTAVELCKQDDDKSKLQGAMLIHKMLSVDDVSRRIVQVLKVDVCASLVKSYNECEGDLKREATSALDNIAKATGSNLDAVLKLGTLPEVINLLESPDEGSRAQACLSVAEVASQGLAFRDSVLAHNVMEPLLRCIQTPSEGPACVKNALWALCILCRDKPRPDLKTVARCLPVVAPLLKHEDEDVRRFACWVISYISDGRQNRIQAFLDVVELDDVIALLSSPNSELVLAAIRTLGNVATGSDDQTQKVVESKALDYFWKLFAHEEMSIRKETAWTISNICGGTQDQIQEVIMNGLIYPLAECLRDDDEKVQEEAAWAIANFASGGTNEQRRYLIDCGCVIEALCGALDTEAADILVVVLGALRNLLQLGEDDKKEKGEEENLVAQKLRGNSTAERIHKLQQHDNTEVYMEALSILETFFPEVVE